MIQPGTQLNIADNSGAKIVECFNIPGNKKNDKALVGDIINGSVKAAIPRGNVKLHDKVKCVIVRTKHPIRRKDGTRIRFDDNSAVIVDKDNQLRSTRIFGPVARELREQKFLKIISLAEEVI